MQNKFFTCTKVNVHHQETHRLPAVGALVISWVALDSFLGVCPSAQLTGVTGCKQARLAAEGLTSTPPPPNCSSASVCWLGAAFPRSSKPFPLHLWVRKSKGAAGELPSLGLLRAWRLLAHIQHRFTATENSSPLATGGHLCLLRPVPSTWLAPSCKAPSPQPPCWQSLERGPGPTSPHRRNRPVQKCIF